jgi:hypothetical protein
VLERILSSLTLLPFQFIWHSLGLFSWLLGAESFLSNWYFVSWPRNFSPRTELEASLMCSEETATGLYAAPHEYNPHLHIQFKIHPTPLRQVCQVVRFLRINFLCISPAPHPCCMPRSWNRPWFDHPENVWWGVHYKLWNSEFCKSFHAHITFSFPWV